VASRERRFDFSKVLPTNLVTQGSLSWARGWLRDYLHGNFCSKIGCGEWSFGWLRADPL